MTQRLHPHQAIPHPPSVTAHPARSSGYRLIGGSRSALESLSCATSSPPDAQRLLLVTAFVSLQEAQIVIEAWRLDYNQRQPHRSLGHLRPNEFVGQCQVSRAAEEVVCSR